MSEQHNQGITDQLQQLGKSAAMAAVSLSSFVDYLKLIRSSSWYMNQYNKTMMILKHHIPLKIDNQVSKKLRTKKDLKAIYRSSENRRKINKIKYEIKLKRGYIIPGRNPNGVTFKNGSRFEIRANETK